jgi:hypothetical protein
MSLGEVILESVQIDRNAASNVTSSLAWAQHLDEITNAAAASAQAAWEASGPHPYETGDYVSSIRPYVGSEGGQYIGRVIADDFKAWWLEVGTSDTPAFAALRLGADGVGLNIEASSG